MSSHPPIEWDLWSIEQWNWWELWSRMELLQRYEWSGQLQLIIYFRICSTSSVLWITKERWQLEMMMRGLFICHLTSPFKTVLDIRIPAYINWFWIPNFRSVPLREMVYGLCETFEITIKSILDERSQPQSNAATGKESLKEESKELCYSSNWFSANTLFSVITRIFRRPPSRKMWLQQWRLL